MSHLKRKTLYLLISFLMLFVLMALFADHWRKKQQPDSLTTIPSKHCDLKIGCTLPDGSMIRAQGKISTKVPFDILISRQTVDTESLFISFSMEGMNMGFNRYKLIPDSSKTQWVAKNIRLPICTSSRKDYLLEITDTQQSYIIPFTAD